MVIALDGNPVDKPFPLDRLDFGPGQRVELVVRMPDTEGAMVRLGNFRGSTPGRSQQLRATGPSLKRDIRDVKPLPANPIAEADLSVARAYPARFHSDGGARASPKHLRHARLYLLGDQ